jgi:hypothetical protein
MQEHGKLSRPEQAANDAASEALLAKTVRLDRRMTG